jgi:hypothetical protein
MRGVGTTVGTTSRILRHVAGVRLDVVFTTRDCLNYGTRAAVDKALSRLVKQQILIRIAWGVFIRAGSKVPDIEVIASVKAKAFGKEIAKHAFEIGKQIQSQTRIEFPMQVNLSKLIRKIDKPKIEAQAIFAASGRTSSFVAGNVRVHLIGVSLRKMQLSKSQAGKALLALCQLGKEMCRQEHILAVSRGLSGLDVREIKQSGALMPAWLARNWIRNH